MYINVYQGQQCEVKLTYIIRATFGKIHLFEQKDIFGRESIFMYLIKTRFRS